MQNRERLADDVRHEQLWETLDAAVRSGDPDVYYRVGMALAHPDVALDARAGYAWFLVACEYGFDCRMGNREIALSCDYHPDYPCDPDELLVEISVPDATGYRSAYDEARERAAFDWPLASVAAAVRIEGGTVRDARIVLGAVAPVPWRCFRA